MKEFKGKTAVVTGGASGIGRGLADKFASERMNVVLADIEESALELAVKEMQEHQHSVIGVVTDTMRKESIEVLLAKTIAEFGNVHILCNNAGIASMTPGLKGVWEIPDADWKWTMGVNFDGVLFGIQTFVPHMLKHGEPSHIVNTASLAGLTPGGGPYGVSKHGVLALTEGLARDLKANNANIGASVLCPGFVNTNILNAERNRPDALQTGKTGPADAQLEVMKGLLTAGKQPSEIADIVFQSIQEDSLYILPHPAWDDWVRSRVETILARGNLPEFDFEDIVRRQKEGEEF
ncbi:MAG: SDR family NAD(P)-dependent oxidoreductase [Gammaproteobacteria bacterium]|nr:SDR family NAD(P)-dependent oxidoreductase [Gammaproteobacteria bacterium]